MKQLEFMLQRSNFRCAASSDLPWRGFGQFNFAALFQFFHPTDKIGPFFTSSY
jgi:hypothetical protein